MSAAQDRRLVSQSLIFYASIYFFAFFKFVGGFIVARLLGPQLFGLRSKFGLITEYEGFAHLGTYDALQREVPFYRGRGETRRVEAILDSVFTINLLYAVAIGLASLVAGQWLATTDVDPLWVDFTRFFAAWVLLCKVAEYFRVLHVADKRSGVLSSVNASFGVLNAGFSIALTWYAGLRGLLVGLLIAQAIRALSYIRAAPRVPRLRIDRGELFRLYRLGFPIMLIALMFLLLRGVDRIIIAGTLSEAELGFFSIGTIVSGLIYLSVGDTVRTMVFPRLMESLGVGEPGPERVRPFLVEPSVLIAYLVPFVIGSAYLALPLPIRWLLPQYEPSILVAQILVIGAFYFSIVSVPLSVCIALNQQVRVTMLSAVAVAINALLSLALIAAGAGIVGVAVGTGISYFLFATVVFLFTSAQIGGRLPALLLLGRLNLPFPIMVALLFGLERLDPWAAQGVWEELALLALRLFIFSAAMGALLATQRNEPAFVRLAGLVGSLPRRGQG